SIAMDFLGVQLHFTIDQHFSSPLQIASSKKICHSLFLSGRFPEILPFLRWNRKQDCPHFRI
ncbi:MAG: hypothetical protein LUF81_03110, partial [Clostridiales bacterium]|nr:hypothetical protein [Clostridiales bacterium]